MSSRILSRSRVLSSRASRLTPAYVGTAKMGIQTSAMLAQGMLSRIKDIVKSVTEQALAKEPLIDKRPEEKSRIINRISAAAKQGGSEGSAGMHLKVPLKAKNVEKAWEIWSTQLRQAEPSSTTASEEDMAGLLVLLVDSSTPHADRLFTDPTKRKEWLHRHQEAASFRIAMVLRYMFSTAIITRYSGQADTASGSTQKGLSVSFEMADLKLGGLCQRDYERIVRSLAFSVDPTMPTGNTESPAFSTAEELATYAANVPTVRLIYAVLCAALHGETTITHPMLHMAIEAAVTMRDTTAARDILRLCYPDLANILDPKETGSVVGGPADVFADPQVEGCREAVELALNAVSVGSDPQIAASTVQAETEQQDDIYTQFEDISAFRDSQSADPSEQTAVYQWRAETAERIYRAYISSGIKEIPSPDNSQQRALQGSAVPSPLMISYLLDTYCKAGNAEKATVLYDAFVSRVLQETGAQDKSVAGMRLWMDVFRSISATGQLWLAARALGDMVHDGCKPTSKMYQRFLSLIVDPNKETLMEAVDMLKQNVLGGALSASNRDIRSPLVCALSRTGLNIPADYTKDRVEQAIALSGLPLPGENAKEAYSGTEPIAVSSMKPVRRIISALMYTGQVSRAQELVELWGAEFPNLVNQRKVAELVDALGSAGEHGAALKIFMDYQQIADNEITVDILSAVLKVYVHAGDYTEALSVGKRLRAMVNDAPQADRQEILPHRDVYELMVRACCEKAMAAEALRILEEMRSYKLNATSETYATLARMMGRLRSYDGIKLVTALAHVDYNMDVTASNSTYQENTRLPSGALPLTTDYYNALIEAYGRVAEPTKAIQCWELMRIRGVKPDNLTATLLFDICGWNERVHWDEDMVMQDEFVELDVPDDHVFTGVPFFHLHFLATILVQLEEAGLEFSLANYRHLIEAMLRYGLFEDVLAMTIGKYEGPELTARYEEESKLLLDRGSWSVFTVVGSFIEKVKDEEIVKPRKTAAMFMESLPIDIPLCKETVHTIYGMIESLRAKCVPEEGIDPPDLPFAQQMSPNLFKRLAISEERLDNILRAHHPDLVPAHKLESLSSLNEEALHQAPNSLE
ncbi:hypothetical protein EV175_003440 [Coemansia sp. RSA 1933]|nr:hypothetical protein EV175_003440 [Coemansia sp. RSA 1933]